MRVYAVPDDWRLDTLGNLTEQVKRGAAPNYATELTGVSAVSQKCVRDGIIDLSVSRPHNPAKSVPEKARLRFGDVCVNSTGTGTLGRVALWQEQSGTYFADTHITVVRPDMRKVDPYFVAAFLGAASTTETIYRECVTGSTNQIELSPAMFAQLVVPVPPLDEQRRIAEVLRSVDEAISLSKKAVEQAECASRGLLQRLFVEGIGHSDFMEGYSTSIPASWKEMSLNNLSAIPITYGVVQPGPEVPNGVPFIRGGDFPNGKIDLGALRTISAQVASQYRRTQLKGGEIVISLVGYPGACAVVPEALAGANIARQAALVRPNLEVTASYLYQFLRSPIGQDRLKTETIGSAQQVINLRDLKEVIVAVPPLHEQKEIATVLGDFDDFVELEMLNLNMLTALKVSISRDLLSGHVRVPA